MLDSPLHHPRRRAGFTLIDALTAVAVVTVVGLFAVMALSRGRESARSATCQRNLGQIGVGLALYHEARGAFPTIAEPAPIDPPTAGDAEAAPPGPLRAVLETLQVPTLLGIRPEVADLAAHRGAVVERVVVPGFVCPSDPRAIGGIFESPVSYRATAGDDPEGLTGGFGVGRRTTFQSIEQADGASYTAAFSERLVGNGRAKSAPENYILTEGPVGAEAAPAASNADWRGDAGSSWKRADWRSTLYNHATAPGSKVSRLARDGRSALMGASSGHTAGIHLLTFDGSVKRIARSINGKIWREFATVGGPSDPSQLPPPPVLTGPRIQTP